MISFFNPVRRLDLVVKQFTDTVDQLEDVIKDCDRECVSISSRITALQSDKDQTMGAMDRALSIKQAIEQNILGVK